MNPGPSISERLTRPFSRVTSSGAFLPQIDGLRCIAILAVFLFHLGIFVQANSPLQPGGGWVEVAFGHLIDKGALGVQLFFAISGFILALIVLVQHQSALALFPNLLASAGYVSYLTAGHPSEINSVAWSLEVEVQFYILAPLLSAVFGLVSPVARRATIVGIMLGGILLSQGLGFTEKTILGNLQYFMAGFFLCDLYLSRWKRRPAATWLWDLGSLAAWVAMAAVQRLGPDWAWAVPVLIVPAYAGAFRGVLLPKILSNPWPVTIGGMCYTIYLYHYFVISFAGRFSTHWLPAMPLPLAFSAQFLLIAPVVLGGCAVLFVLFERPFMSRDWPARLAALVTGKTSESALRARKEAA